MLDDPSEHVLQVRVLDYIKVAGRRDIYAFAVPNAARRSLRHGARMKAEGLKRGVADVCIMFPDGIAKWMELKTLRGRQSDHQKGFEAICGRLNHDYALIRTLDEAIEVLRQWRALR